MSWTVDSSGTQTATGGGTPDTLVAGATTNATYVLKVDTINMVNGDILELRVLTKTLTGSTLHQCWKMACAHVQINPVVISPPVASDFSISCTLTQLAGTGRAYAWSLLRQ